MPAKSETFGIVFRGAKGKRAAAVDGEGNPLRFPQRRGAVRAARQLADTDHKRIVEVVESAYWDDKGLPSRNGWRASWVLYRCSWVDFPTGYYRNWRARGEVMGTDLVERFYPEDDK